MLKLKKSTDKTAKHNITILGVASCYGAQVQSCDTAPFDLQNMDLTKQLQSSTNNIRWDPIILPKQSPKTANDNTSIISDICQQLYTRVHSLILDDEHFVIIGGDHSCAIGTWSGAASAHKNIGLIWIDAHMDCHTPDTSKSGAIHGMPLACLLGYGDPQLCHIGSKQAKIKPENICLVGIRSFEAEEAALLNKLGVKVFYMDEIRQQGLNQIMQKAHAHIMTTADYYGVSLDLDAVDPTDAPGVGSPESNGIRGQSLIEALSNLPTSGNFLGLEIVELNTSRDQNNKTSQLAIQLIKATFE